MYYQPFCPLFLANSLRTRRGHRPVAVVSILLLVSACASSTAGRFEVERRLAADRPSYALQALKAQNRGWARRDKVLYLLNKAMLLRINSDFKASNHAFEQAKRRMAKLQGVSLTEGTGSLIVNDNIKKYVGEEFEQVLLHVYKALNYLEMGEADAARVEALQVDIKLRQYAKRIAKTKYIEDAFARYIAGLIYEDHGEWSDAMIEYRRAYEAYEQYRKHYAVDVPRSLQRDLVRLADRLGLYNEVQQYKQRFGLDDWSYVGDVESEGELIFVLHNGLAPVKREDEVVVSTPHVLVKVALPYYQPRSTPAVGARITVNGEERTMELVEDVSAIAIWTLKMKMPMIRARAIARAGIKGAVASELKRQDEWLLGLLVEVAGVLSERADTRSWFTLPHNIYMGRMRLPPGDYTVTLELLGRNHAVIDAEDFQRVTIRPARKTFVSYHWIVPKHLLDGARP